jgi:hypothetical protein
MLTLPEFCLARHALWLERSYGIPAESISQNTDPLRQYHYTNLWRELDRHSVYLFNNVQPKSEGNAKLVADTICYRAFNRIDTHEAILEQFGDWPTARADATALYAFLSARQKNFTGAYVRCPDLKRVCEALADLREVATRTAEALEASATNRAWKLLREIYSFGDFLVDQLVMDLVWQGGAFHGNFMPSLGPGAVRGLAHCADTGQGDWDALLQAVDAELPLDTRPTVAGTAIVYDARALEHSLCEYYKYIKHSSSNGKKVKMRTYATSSKTLDRLPSSWVAPAVVRYAGTVPH